MDGVLFERSKKVYATTIMWLIYKDKYIIGTIYEI